MVDVSVRAMTQVEFDEWWEALGRSYAADQIAAGNWSPDKALELARQGNANLLPDGLATPGMLLLHAVRGDGTRVGVLWIGLTHPRGVPDCAFLYDIEVDEEHRGAGYGRALLAASEDLVRSHGVSRFELNVFGGNTRALGLYESAGYRVVTQQMRKNLAP
jgi:ribosomal protein S18 acetylase RimI-like enzyme